MSTMVSPRLDRTGRILVLLGGLIVGPLIALPLLGFAAFAALTGTFYQACDAACAEWALVMGAVLLGVAPYADLGPQAQHGPGAAGRCGGRSGPPTDAFLPRVATNAGGQQR